MFDEAMVLEEVCRIVGDVTGGLADRETSSCNREDWDSISQIKIVTEVEDTFSIVFPTTEMAKLTSVETLVRGVEELVKRKAPG